MSILGIHFYYCCENSIFYNMPLYVTKCDPNCLTDLIASGFSQKQLQKEIHIIRLFDQSD